MDDTLRVVAHLDSMLAGEPPMLDSLLVYLSCRMAGKPEGLENFKVDRSRPCPDSSNVPISLLRRNVAGWNIALCTSPILDEAIHDGTEHIAKRIGVEHSNLIAPTERKVVTTTKAWTKSYRLPLRVRRVDRVAWLCRGNARELRKSLKQIPAIGKKIADGYGRVASWEVERIEVDAHRYWPWWEWSEGGAGPPVLMRPLPLAWDGLPANLIGARRDFGACVDPYWHGDRYTEIVVPC